MRTAHLLPYGGSPQKKVPLDRDMVMWPVVHAGTEPPPPVNRTTDRPVQKHHPAQTLFAGSKYHGLNL